MPPRKVEQRDRAIAEAAEVRACYLQCIKQRQQIAHQLVVAAEWGWRCAGAAVPTMVVGQYAATRGKTRQMLAPIGFDCVERAVKQHQRFAAGLAVQLIIDFQLTGLHIWHRNRLSINNWTYANWTYAVPQL